MVIIVIIILIGGRCSITLAFYCCVNLETSEVDVDENATNANCAAAGLRNANKLTLS